MTLPEEPFASPTKKNDATTTFSYDVMDRLTEQTGFDGRHQRYSYDLTGKLTQSADENLLTGWHYDAADRLTHRTVSGEPAEQWQYSEKGWLMQISHLSEGHRVAVHYDYDKKGRPTSERQTVHNPQTDELLWQHQTRQGYSKPGLANRFKPDNLPPVEWLTYGSGYLAGMKLGDTPLIELTRDRLHREIQRNFGNYEQTTAYTAGGQLQHQHLNNDLLNRDYSYDTAGQLTHIHGPLQTRHYRYSDSGRLTSVRTTAANLDITLPYATDPAGNRLPAPEFYPDGPFTEWKNNRITEDAHYLYRYDLHGRLTEKTDRIPDYAARMDDERTHRYGYDNQHRLIHYTRTQYNTVQAEGRYLYDPLGRRIGKQVWKLERDHPDHEQMAFSRKPYVTWYGWESDRLVTEQTQHIRIQTLYTPGSFTPLIRIETDVAELAKAQRRSLAEKLQQEGSGNGQPLMMPPVLIKMLDKLEAELRVNAVSEENLRWLAGCGLTVERMAAQLEPVYEPQRKIHLYHCDHRGLPLALVDSEGNIVWQAEYNEWGYQLSENNPHNITQNIRLPGQQYDEESGLHYNRHRYYEPLTGRYITQDPIGLAGGWNLYQYPLDPVGWIDSLGLAAKYGHLKNGGYGMRPSKPPKPNPGQLPRIAEKLMPQYSIDQASSESNVFKTLFTGFSPYDYTLYCKKWVKPNLTCMAGDDPKYPGMDTKTASDYLPVVDWPADRLPAGYTCAGPYLFPDLDDPGGAATAGIDDLADLVIKGMQRTARGVRK